MSTMLNFKYGSFSKLPKDKSAGTIYVTTDEKAMYVDLPSASNETIVDRIRLSQIIILSTYEWQSLDPPYSTEAFYYISDANALLKYDGEGQRWVQLNSTADLENSLRALGFLGILDDFPDTGEKGQICIVGGQNYIYNPEVTGDFKWVALSNVGGKILDIEATIDALDGRLDSAEAKLEKLELAMDTAQSDIDNLEKVVGFIGKVEVLPDSANVGDICIHNSTVYVWVAAVGTEGGEGYVAAHWEAEGNVSVRIEELKSEIARVEQTAGTAEGVKELATRLETLEGTVTHTETGLAATKKVADEAKKTADTAVQTETFTAFQEANTQEIDGVKQSIQETNSALSTTNAAIDAIKNGSTLDSFADVEAALENAKTENGKTYATKTELSNAQTAILGKAGYTQTVKSAYEEGVAAAAEASKANGAIDAMKADATITTFKGIEDKINGLTVDNIGGMNAYATDVELSDAVAAARGETTETVASVNVKAVQNAADIVTLNAAVNTLSDSVDKKIQVADAMTYEGTVSSEAELLAKTNVNKGDTYKAVADFKMNDDTTFVFIGDLLIATGTENEETGVLDTVIWDHVPSGYRADYVPALAVNNGAENDNSVVVNLTSAHADTGVTGDLGNITIAAAADSAVTITAINTANNAGSIAIGMAWGSF